MKAKLIKFCYKAVEEKMLKIYATINEEELQYLKTCWTDVVGSTRRCRCVWWWSNGLVEKLCDLPGRDAGFRSDGSHSLWWNFVSGMSRGKTKMQYDD